MDLGCDAELGARSNAAIGRGGETPTPAPSPDPGPSRRGHVFPDWPAPISQGRLASNVRCPHVPMPARPVHPMSRIQSMSRVCALARLLRRRNCGHGSRQDPRVRWIGHERARHVLPHVATPAAVAFGHAGGRGEPLSVGWGRVPRPRPLAGMHPVPRQRSRTGPVPAVADIGRASPMRRATRPATCARHRVS